MVCNHRNKHTEKIKKILQNNKIPPDPYNLTETEIGQVTDIMLNAITQNQKTNGGNRTKNAQRQLYPCPTCEYVGEKEHLLQRHRKMKPHRQKQMEQENNNRKCQEPERSKEFPTRKGLNRHNTFYCNDQTRKQQIMQESQLHKFDRRKPLQEGIANYRQ